MDDTQKAINACVEGKLDIIKNMHINGIKLDQTVLESAAENGKLEIVQYLVETCGLKVLANKREAMKRATNGGHSSIFFYLQKKAFEEVNATPIPKLIPTLPK